MNLPPIERNKNNALIRMTPIQHKSANALIRKTCCNYCDGQCVALDCECIQMISYSVCCKWFRHCVLPQDKSLLAESVQPQQPKHCAVCGKSFVPKSNRGKYCEKCSKSERKRRNKMGI
ncbi:MAG: conjugal transfer protein [Clostridia bacterium]|nr:conjugal transfer protein [Clostridia bacterium]